MPPVDMSMLPSGRDLPPGQKATDAISRTLATINPGEMQVVMSSMKAGPVSRLYESEMTEIPS